MNAPKYYLVLWPVIAALLPLEGTGQQSSNTVQTNSQQLPTKRDGQHDFDFEIGTWNTHLWHLVDPLTGSTKWVQYEGTSVVRKIWNGRGEFFSHETLNERAIFVRFVISDITPDSCRFEQAFSDDGSKTWEANWIAIGRRVENETD
jgi:hypothetical protein